MDIEKPIDEIIQKAEKVTNVLELLGEAFKERRHREAFTNAVIKDGRYSERDSRAAAIAQTFLSDDLTYAALCNNISGMILIRQGIVMSLDDLLAKENSTQEEVNAACDDIVESIRQIEYLVNFLYQALHNSKDEYLKQLPFELYKHLATSRYVYDKIRRMMKYDASSHNYDKGIFEDQRSREKLKEFSFHMKRTVDFLCEMKVQPIAETSEIPKQLPSNSSIDVKSKKARREDLKQLILFVHGLGGHPSQTWGRFPEFLESLPEIRERFNIATFSFPTMIFRLPFLRKTPKLQELAASLATYIRYCDHYRVNLICHSLGGLVARRYLIEEVKIGRPLIVPRLALFAVPNNGSDLAKVAGHVSWRNQQLSQLCRDADILEMMNQDWSTFRVQEKVRTKFIIGTQDAIVDRFSAARTWGNQDTETIGEVGHRAIVKPERLTDLSVKIVHKLLLSDPL
jgi:hypothetical protein